MDGINSYLVFDKKLIINMFLLIDFINKNITNYSIMSDIPPAYDSDTESENTSSIYSGLVLKGEYVLLKKIGEGNNASIWMTYYIPKDDYIAMKIQYHQCFNDGCREVKIIEKINEYAKANPEKNIHCVNMTECFIFEEDDDIKFVCSAYPLYAGSIQLVLNSGKHKYGLPIPVVKNIIRQMLKAVDTLHNELQIIHTDIKPENILFQGTTKDHIAIIDLFQKSGFKENYQKILKEYADNSEHFDLALDKIALESVVEIDQLVTNYDDWNEEFDPDNEEIDEDDIIEGEDDEYYDEENVDEIDEDLDKFNERVQSVDDIIETLDYNQMHNIEEESEYDFVSVLNNRQNTTDPEEVIDDKYIENCVAALTDFGNSYFYQKRTRNEIQDRRYRAPEVVLDFKYGYGADVWSIACVAFELLTGFVLFDPADEPLNKDIHLLYLFEKMLGPIPFGMKKKSKRTRFLFDHNRNYHIKNIEEFEICTLEERLIKQFLFSENDAKEIAEFLGEALHYEPHKRATTKDLLNHKWLN